MTPNRRKFIAGASCTAALAGIPASPALAYTATRRFGTILGRNQVGETSVTLTRSGADIVVDVDARLHISILGLISFDYHLNSREIWRDGQLQQIRSTTDNDGSAEYVFADRMSSGIRIDASGFQGVVSGNPATTSYFTDDFMTRPTWISTQSGKPLGLTIQNNGAAQFETNEGSLTCTKYTTHGDLNVGLYYDQNTEWVGSSFSVIGRSAFIRMTSRGQSLNDIWDG